MPETRPRERPRPTHLCVRCEACHQRFCTELSPEVPTELSTAADDIIALLGELWSHERRKHQPVAWEGGRPS
jgi:hypothetical protein